jgi:hypothetical protein
VLEKTKETQPKKHFSYTKPCSSSRILNPLTDISTTQVLYFEICAIYADNPNIIPASFKTDCHPPINSSEYYTSYLNTAYNN